ncbi:MAG: RsmB/NOP family class I SAM-dependent RNA methyltransferase [Xanthomonadales bacterium]|jgi:16S rRNA (cytosine967-C5)-methyltransferase|nr:RsmB/NOP family class I SAM-dependent RNA methyltransferase [Xanthomonadales bacterium]
MPKHDSPPARGNAAPARITKRQLEALSEVLLQVLSFRYPADQVLSRFFRANKQLGGGDRRFIAESVYTGLRHYYWVKAMLAGETSPRRFGLAVLLGPRGFSVSRLEQLLSPADLRWAREAKGRKAGDALWEQAELPPWIVSALAEQYDDATILSLGRALQQPAPLDLRVNTIKAQRDQVLKQLQADDSSIAAGTLSPTAIRLPGKPALQRHPLLLEGAIEVQDEGSQLVSLLLDPQAGERVVDFCAGAGGKTLHIGALMNSKGRIDAYDVSERRLKRLGPRLARSGLSNVRAQAISHERDSHLKNRLGKADRVLVDAPCTGLGTIRRNPDLKFRQSEKTLQELTQQQASILAAAARLVRPGGRLVYATCSLMHKENQAIVDGFLEQSPSFKRLSVAELLTAKGIDLDTGEDLVLLPHEHSCDGFYAAVLERQSDE